MSLDFEQSNFMSSLLVKHHEVLVFHRDKVRLSDLLDSYTSKFFLTTQSDRRKVIVQQVIDPAISIGTGKCVIANADNFYESFVCSFNKKGFLQLYLYVYDETGMLGSISLLNNWAVYKPYAIQTFIAVPSSTLQLTLHLRGGHSTYLHAAISSNFNNVSLDYKYFVHKDLKIASEVLATLDFKDKYKRGNVTFKGSFNDYMYNYGQTLVAGRISYEADKYELYLYDNDNGAENSLNMKGGYAMRSWNNW